MAGSSRAGSPQASGSSSRARSSYSPRSSRARPRSQRRIEGRRTFRPSMLRSIVQACLRFRGVVIALACAVLVYGLEVASQAQLDVFPEFVQPQVTIQTEAPGLAAEQVEVLVTTPVENAISGVVHLSA